MKSTTIQQFFKAFPSDEACLNHIMETRYGMESECPHCNKLTRFSRVTSQRAFACQWCGWHTYPCVGTPFEDSRTSLQLWFYAIYLFTQTRSGVSAKELQRQLGVTYKCAWRIGHKIREHMGFVDGNEPLNGDVEVDETYIGGYRQGGQGGKGKTVLFGMLDRDGDVMTKVVPDRTSKTLFPIIEDNIEKGSTLHTDEHKGYRSVSKLGYEHESVNHAAKEYARGNCHTNTIEGFWSRLKLSINGTHIHVSGKHLDKYAAEFEYRFNSRGNPSEMLSELLGTFEPLKK
jgi:transposase-like protein/predicted RNA-binding Zn-ribbon protein involved in translation (DUF1610 family)